MVERIRAWRGWGAWGGRGEGEGALRPGVRRGGRVEDGGGGGGGGQGEAALRREGGGGVGSTIGLMVPLALATAGWLPLDAAFVVIAAHSMTLVDVRGAYPVRFAFLLAMALVLAGTTLL